MTEDEQYELAERCNQRERAFVREYVIDLNGTQAVLRAGCFHVANDANACTVASRLLERAHVRALIAVEQAQRAARVNMTADSVLQELALLSHSDATHYVIDDAGNVELAPGAPEGATRAIQSIKRKKTIKEDKEGKLNITYDVELRLWGKPDPLKLMGKHVGLFTDRVEVTGKDGAPLLADVAKMSIAELQEAISALGDLAAKLPRP